MPKENKRVVFYSASDMSSWWNLANAEKLLNAVEVEKEFWLNELLEFYNVNKYFDNKIFLKDWSEEDKGKYVDIAKILLKKVFIFFNGINDNNIINYVTDLEFNYEEDFWHLVCVTIYKDISTEKILEILRMKWYFIHIILKHRNIVNHFNKGLRVFLLDYDESWKILLDYIDSDKKIFFPPSLSNDDKETIIAKYIEEESVPLIYLEMVQKISNWFLKIPAKTKLKARKIYQKKNEEFFEKNQNVMRYWFQVGIDIWQVEPLKIEEKDGWISKVTYSLNYLNSFDFTNDPLNIFKNTFWYLDKKWFISLISKASQISITEWLFTHWSRSDYKTSHVFKHKEMKSFLDLCMLESYLKNHKNESIEKIINNYVLNVLSKFDDLDQLNFELTSYDLPFHEKITNLIPKIDSLIKQYRCFAEEWRIDFELIDIDSKPISYDSIPSLLSDKYFYETGNEFANLKHSFYSDQSSLFYIEWFEGKYNNFFDLIINEKLKLDNFHDYQKREIESLITEWILFLDSKKVINIKDMTLMLIMKDIYHEWVLHYHLLDWEMQDKIIEMKSERLLLSESTLLSRQEVDYINYYFNKSKFLNWPDIRNKNIHWHKYISEDESFSDYMILLKITVLILLKIDLELNIHNALSTFK